MPVGLTFEPEKGSSKKKRDGTPVKAD